MKKRWVVLVLLCAAFVILIHGYIDMSMVCKRIVNGYAYSDSMRNLVLDENDMRKMFFTASDDSGINHIVGLDENTLQAAARKMIYSSIGKKGRIPIIFNKCVPIRKYNKICKVYQKIFKDVRYFPVAKDVNGKVETPYEDSWNAKRTYGGDRNHEGTDIMAGNNTRGYFPVVSMTDGVVENKGWLKLGGYRIGIRSKSGAYFYYAHLAGYADGIEEGSVVKAGNVIGTMGDTGYSDIPGTTGNFDVHLHLGIYVNDGEKEVSYNPFYILKALENYRMEFVF